MATKPTSAEALYERVAWDEREVADDGYGNEVGGFVEQFQTRARFRYGRGSETVMAARLEGRQPMVVRVRASSQTRMIAADWQMRDVRTGKVYAVKGDPIPTEDRRWLDIDVERGVAS